MHNLMNEVLFNEFGTSEGKEDESEKRLDEDRGEKIGVEASPHPGPGLPSKLKINKRR